MTHGASGRGRMFCFVQLVFTISPTGKFESSFMIEGMNLQEYMSPTFYVQLILEVLLFIWTTAQVLVEVLEMAGALREHGCMKVGDRSPLLRGVPACVFSRPAPGPAPPFSLPPCPGHRTD